MDEYIIDVVINGKPDSLKTWCGSVYSAVDSMIGIDMVEDIKTITRSLDGKIWDVKDMDIDYLRNLKENIDNNVLSDAFKTIEDLTHDSTH
tara:strand:- start:72 stop:344 length:273 start_codon:yes stop_codon:yes gene_type:complete